MRATKTAVTKVARGELSRDAIVDKALLLAAEDGLDAVTIRRLANEFGVTPMALYWHFSTKEDLLAATAERVLDGIVLQTPVDAPWPDRLRNALVGLVDALRQNPQIAPLVAERIVTCESGLDLTERALGALADAGFDTAQAAQIAGQALLTAITLVTSDGVDDSGTSAAGREEHLRMKQALLASLPADRFPHIRAASQDMTRCPDIETYFEFGVELFIAGVVGLAPHQS